MNKFRKKTTADVTAEQGLGKNLLKVDANLPKFDLTKLLPPFLTRALRRINRTVVKLINGDCKTWVVVAGLQPSAEAALMRCKA